MKRECFLVLFIFLSLESCLTSKVMRNETVQTNHLLNNSSDMLVTTIRDVLGKGIERISRSLKSPNHSLLSSNITPNISKKERLEDSMLVQFAFLTDKNMIPSSTCGLGNTALFGLTLLSYSSFFSHAVWYFSDFGTVEHIIKNAARSFFASILSFIFSFSWGVLISACSDYYSICNKIQTGGFLIAISFFGLIISGGFMHRALMARRTNSVNGDSYLFDSEKPESIKEAFYHIKSAIPEVVAILQKKKYIPSVSPTPSPLKKLKLNLYENENENENENEEDGEDEEEIEKKLDELDEKDERERRLELEEKETKVAEKEEKEDVSDEKQKIIDAKKKAKDRMEVHSLEEIKPKGEEKNELLLNDQGSHTFGVEYVGIKLRMLGRDIFSSALSRFFILLFLIGMGLTAFPCGHTSLTRSSVICGPGMGWHQDSVTEQRGCQPLPCPENSLRVASNCLCQAGYAGKIEWKDFEWNGECKACPEKSYTNQVGQQTCKECGSGYYTSVSSAATQCSSCADNPSKTGVVNSCLQKTGNAHIYNNMAYCPPGFFGEPVTAARVSSISCEECALNEFSGPETITRVCFPNGCPVATYLSGSGGCYECPAGTVQDVKNHQSTSCRPCHVCSVGVERVVSVCTKQSDTVCACLARYTGSPSTYDRPTTCTG
eukprot:c19576_g1_i1.p1 GENE.c19576_g1_i1~~c19576_g1_i1.p1  ORF type:complete len:671 (+),score=210.81 c19576_g1_i1:30-2015(+)